FFAENRHHVVSDVHEAALHLKAMHVPAASYPHNTGSEDRHEWRVAPEDADLSIPRGHHHALRVAIENRRLGRDDDNVEGARLGSGRGLGCGHQLPCSSLRAFSIVSSIPPTM